MRLLTSAARPHVFRTERSARCDDRGTGEPADRIARADLSTTSTRRWSRRILLGLLQEALVLSQTAEPIEKRIRVEGVKTGKVTALDLPGQIGQALAAGIISETEAACAARVRPQGHGDHQRRRLRAERAGHAVTALLAAAAAARRQQPFQAFTWPDLS